MGRDKKGKLQKQPPLNSNLTGKEAMRNNWNGGGKNKGRGNSRLPPSAGELQSDMAAMGP